MAVLYKVPDGKKAVDCVLVFCNRDTAATTFRISLANDADSEADSQFIYYDMPLLEKDTFQTPFTFGLVARWVVRIKSANGMVNVSMLGKLEAA